MQQKNQELGTFNVPTQKSELYDLDIKNYNQKELGNINLNQQTSQLGNINIEMNNQQLPSFDLSSSVD